MAEALPEGPDGAPTLPAAVANTLALPCRAAAVLRVPDLAAAERALGWCRESGLAPLPLGAGSNVLLPRTLSRAVLYSSDHSVEELERDDREVLLRIGAGRNWHELVTLCLEREYYGLENLALIPGTVGAAPVQNIGAYGVEIAQFLHRVHGLHLDSGEALSLDREDCRFAYRDSIFKRDLRGRFMITAVELRLFLQPELCLDYHRFGSSSSATALRRRRGGSSTQWWRCAGSACRIRRRSRTPGVFSPIRSSAWPGPRNSLHASRTCRRRPRRRNRGSASCPRRG